MNPIQIYYRFDYFHKKDIMQFSIKVGLAPVVLIGMDAESFFNLCEGVVGLGHPFLEDVNRIILISPLSSQSYWVAIGRLQS